MTAPFSEASTLIAWGAPPLIVRVIVPSGGVRDCDAARVSALSASTVDCVDPNPPEPLRCFTIQSSPFWISAAWSSGAFISVSVASAVVSISRAFPPDRVIE